MKYLFILSLFLVGCGQTPVIANTPTFSPVVCEDFGQINPVAIYPVEFVQAKTEDGFNVLGLRGDMYSNLSIMFKDVIRYINEQKQAISYYEKCIANHNAKAL